MALARLGRQAITSFVFGGSMLIHSLRVGALSAALLPVVAAAAPLTLEQALDSAVQRAMTTRAAHAAVASATEAARAAGQLPDPQLIVGVENLPVTGADRFSTTADSMTMKRIGISQEWISGDKRTARRAAASAVAARESVMEHAGAADVRLQTALAYLDAYYAAEALKLAELSEHHLHEELEAAKGRLASFAGTSQEVLALVSARGVAEDDSADLRQTQSSANVSLQRWVGRYSDELAAPVLPASASEQDYVAMHPAVLTAQREIEVARQEANLAAANRNPNWTWQVSYGQRAGFSDLITFGVTIPLPVSRAERQDRDRASKLALVEKAEAVLEEATRAATAEFGTLSSDAQRLAERIERYQSAVVFPAQQRTQAALAGYRSNQVSLTILFEARHTEVEVQRKLLTLQRERDRTRAQLAYKPLVGALQ